jgi:hypothetical protein
MKPKEKAEELVNQYRMILMDEDTDCGNEILCSIIAIKCALIAVDEILNTCVEFSHGRYWEDVKQEIKKL